MDALLYDALSPKRSGPPVQKKYRKSKEEQSVKHEFKDFDNQ